MTHHSGALIVNFEQVITSWSVADQILRILILSLKISSATKLQRFSLLEKVFLPS